MITFVCLDERHAFESGDFLALKQHLATAHSELIYNAHPGETGAYARRFT